MAVPEGIEDFAGHWRIKRRIDDLRAGQVIRGQGTATFVAVGARRLTCDEALTLELTGQKPLQGQRRYLWEGDEGAINVLFDDGRFFHRIALGALRSEDLHDCPPDLYAGDYDFSNWPLWRARWRVRGPRKDYVMVTDYRRAAG
ncbi:DUF6314 family protein [Jhaorihella thermophila]|uniref:DUF6314 domain-containing protein n=1 Tax=Jhaorihella thermophila TaxID=488547 RepID=A0A1H5WII9_9RHOB|nr:DUF6314 family protein [Jhaorihella thermophila]SEF99439.1 hypothetical protein SAMN05421751_10859 [Jhaorihella thermophila]